MIWLTLNSTSGGPVSYSSPLSTAAQIHARHADPAMLVNRHDVRRPRQHVDQVGGQVDGSREFQHDIWLQRGR